MLWNLFMLFFEGIKWKCYKIKLRNLQTRVQKWHNQVAQYLCKVERVGSLKYVTLITSLPDLDDCMPKTEESWK